jgi:hypothetical protein
LIQKAPLNIVGHKTNNGSKIKMVRMDTNHGLELQQIEINKIFEETLNLRKFAC